MRWSKARASASQRRPDATPMALRRALSLLLALVLALPGGFALARPGCVHADTAAVTVTADGEAHAGHEGHAVATHDHGAMPLPGDPSDPAATDDPCAEDCRCQGLCAVPAPCAIVAGVQAIPRSYPADRPDPAPLAGHSAIPPQRLLRPPIVA